MRTPCVLILCFLIAACGNGTTAHPASTTYPITLAAHLPVMPEDVVSFAEHTGIDRQSTVLPMESGGFILVFSSFAEGDMDTSHLNFALSRHGTEISAPHPITFNHPVEDAPTFVNTANGSWLYYASSDKDLRNVKLWRTRVHMRTQDALFELPQQLATVDGLDRLDQWPRWVEAGEDVFMTFRHHASGPTWLRLRNGIISGVPMLLQAGDVAYPRVVPTREHGCFFSYQYPPKDGYMATWYRVSPDCIAWSPARELTRPTPPNKADVHDAYALPRHDGGVDVYYVYPSWKGESARFPIGFDLYRRAVTTDGTTGAEQQLTDPARFNPFAPAAHRLADGTILVTFSDIQETGANGVERSNLTLFKLGQDAPLPD